MNDFIYQNDNPFQQQQPIYEMANIGPRLHRFGVDVTLHLLQPGDRRLPHGPRAKFFKKGIEGDFSVALSEDPSKVRIAAGSYRGIISQSEAERLLEKVRKYRIPLLNFWYDPKMDTDELREQLDMIDHGKSVVLVMPDEHYAEAGSGQPIYEMANVAPEDHDFGVNLKMHILQPGDKWPGHGPRVKFFRHNSKTDYISISLHPDASRIAIVARGKDAPATGREENILLAKVKQYCVPLWNMYHDPDMTQRELLLEMGEIDAGRQVLLRGGRHAQPIKL